MSRALVVLDTEFQRRRAADWCWSLKHGTRVEFKAPKRSDDQNAKMWAMLTEVSTQLKWHGVKLTPDDWKLQFLDALRRSKQEELRIVPNIDSTGFVNLSTSSSDLSKEEMSDLIELIFKFGAEHDIKFHETSDARLSSGEGSDGNPAPQTPPVAAPLSADEADSDEAGEHEAAGSQSAAPASSPNDEPTWLRDFAKLIVASIGPDEAVVVNSSKGMFRDDLSEDARTRAKAIINYARAACRGELELASAREIIARKAGVEEKELAS